MCVQVDTSSCQLAHQQAAIDYCFKPGLQHKNSGIAVHQAVLNVLATLREVADFAQVCRQTGHKCQLCMQ